MAVKDVFPHLHHSFKAFRADFEPKAYQKGYEEFKSCDGRT